MRIFVGEYVSGGGQWNNPDPALLPEGRLMAARMADDLTAIAGVQVLLAQDPSIPPLHPNVELYSDPDWSKAIETCDAAWVVAPESDGILERLARMGETKSRLWLGCRSDAIRITTSKIATARILADAGIPSIPTPDKCGDIPSSLTGWVAKPDDGAGACDMIATFDHDHLQGWLKSRRHSHVVQPRIEGVHASATFLARDGQASLLCLNSQILEMSDTECQYRGGIVGCFEEHREQVTKIVESVVQTIPGLWGPVGLDLILTEAGPVVVEINPRLTTLWSGLGQSMGLNPAQLVLDLAEGRPLPVCRPLNEVQVIV